MAQSGKSSCLANGTCQAKVVPFNRGEHFLAGGYGVGLSVFARGVG